MSLKNLFQHGYPNWLNKLNRLHFLQKAVLLQLLCKIDIVTSKCGSMLTLVIMLLFNLILPHISPFMTGFLQSCFAMENVYVNSKIKTFIEADPAIWKFQKLHIIDKIHSIDQNQYVEYNSMIVIPLFGKRKTKDSLNIFHEKIQQTLSFLQ